MKRTYVFLIVAILIVSSLAFFKIKSKTLTTQAAYGYSVSDDETKAVNEVALMIKKKIIDPGYIILYSTSGYNSDRLFQFYADCRLLLNGVSSTPETAMIIAGIEKYDPEFALYTLCSGRLNSIPHENRSDIPAIFSETIGKNVPFIGHLTCGEQGPLGIVNHHANLSYSTFIFRRRVTNDYQE